MVKEVTTTEKLDLCPVCWPKFKEPKIGETAIAPALTRAEGSKEGYCPVCKRTWSELVKWMEERKVAEIDK